MSVQYMAIIREHTFDPALVTEKMWKDTMAAHQAFNEAVAQAGGTVIFTGGLDADNAWTSTPAVDGSAAVFSDGPFAESREVNHGFYVVELPETADARTLLSMIPSGGHVELYPIMHGASYPKSS